jgi:hypothetical protein
MIAESECEKKLKKVKKITGAEAIWLGVREAAVRDKVASLLCHIL